LKCPHPKTCSCGQVVSNDGADKMSVKPSRGSRLLIPKRYLRGDIPKVNQPIVATSDAEHRTSVEVSYKPPISMGGS
jgi:hypothetical protein